MSAPDVNGSLASRLEPAYDEQQIADAWDRIATARRGARPPRQGRWVVALGIAATALVAVIALATRGRDGERAGAIASRDGAALAPGSVVDAVAQPRTLELADRSRVELAAATRLEVIANDGKRFVTLLSGGRARFDVTPGGPRLWSIETALATIEVVGTAFTVEDRSDALVVSVEHGVVMVRGERVPNRVVRLLVGQQLAVPRVVTADAPRVEQAAAAGPNAAAELAVPAAAPAERPTADAPRVERPAAAGSNAADLATGGGAHTITPSSQAAAAPPPTRPARARDAAVVDPTRANPTPSHGPSPPSRPGPVAAAPPATGVAEPLADVLKDADRLRAAGQAARAADRLDAAIAASPNDPGAGVAAFMLGRLALDTLHDPARAARAFAIVIDLGSPHSLVEDAHARRAEALIRSGDRRAAVAAIEGYERAYPGGRRAAALRSLLERSTQP